MLSSFEFSLVYNMFSFTFAVMFAAFLFFVMVRSHLSPQYRLSMILSAIVVAVAGYHYFRIFESWGGAYIIDGGNYIASGKPFADSYRYVDWLLTVPLLVAELVIVINPKNRGSLIFRLAFAAALMVILGYPGEVSTDNNTRLLWGTLSTIPFLYIVYVLFTGLASSVSEDAPEATVLIRNSRLLLLLTWGFYPIVYLLPTFGLEPSNSIVALQIGYCIADVAAKAGFGLLIYAIGVQKSKSVGYVYS